MLTRYVRDKDNQKIGVVVAIGRGRIGWSACNQGPVCKDYFLQEKDIFNKKLGLKIALGRAEKGSRKRIPDQLLRTVVDSYQAAELYFKEK